MERVVTEKVDDEGLRAFFNKRITVFCMNYIYTGKLVGVNDSCIKLEDASIVYETGPLNDAIWKDAQKLPNAWYVQTASIESFGALK